MITIDDKNFLLVLKIHKADHEAIIKSGRANSETFPTLDEAEELVDVIRKVLKNKQINMLGAALLYAYSFENLKQYGFPEIDARKNSNGTHTVSVGAKNPPQDRLSSFINEHHIITMFLNRHYEAILDGTELLGLFERKEVA